MIDKKEGIIVFLKKIKDNDLFIRVLSSNDELISGMVYGGNSSKKKLIFQIGHVIDYSLIQKSKNIVPTISAELTKPFIISIINDKFKSYSLLGIISLINLSIVEGQKVKGFYKSVKNIVEILTIKKKWITYFCEWLFELLQIIGYQIDYKNKKAYNYFNLISHDFDITMNDNTIIFPHKIFEHSGKVSLVELSAIFKIFESIYTKNHLDNMNYKMPINFINFQNIVLHQLNKN